MYSMYDTSVWDNSLHKKFKIVYFGKLRGKFLYPFLLCKRALEGGEREHVIIKTDHTLTALDLLFYSFVLQPFSCLLVLACVKECHMFQATFELALIFSSPLPSSLSAWVKH